MEEGHGRRLVLAVKQADPVLHVGEVLRGLDGASQPLRALRLIAVLHPLRKRRPDSISLIPITLSRSLPPRGDSIEVPLARNKAVTARRTPEELAVVFDTSALLGVILQIAGLHPLGQPSPDTISS